MKKIIIMLLALCMMTTLFMAVACNDVSHTDTTVGEDETNIPDSTPITEPPSVDDTAENTEDNVYISISPSNDEQKWGELNRAEN